MKDGSKSKIQIGTLQLGNTKKKRGMPSSFSILIVIIFLSFLYWAGVTATKQIGTGPSATNQIVSIKPLGVLDSFYAILVMGKLSHDTLMNKGLEAYLSMAHHASSPSVEDIIETNIYLAGIAGESGGLAAVHATHNGFTLIPETHNILHGEKVSFCTIVQLVLEDQSRELLSQVINFCLDVGLPVSLADLNIKNIDYDLIKKVSELACAPKESIHREPFKVTPDMVYNAILSANEIGNYYKNKRS